ncbi:MAG: segregation and condensation protein A, partial [Aeromicrobium sp.]
MSAADIEPSAETGFSVNLTNFEGPFDLLLGLISKHKLDITEVALSTVTNEFIAYIKKLGGDLEQTTQFLVVASTLLDLKTSRLLPQAEVEDEEDLALLEARDLLFARLMQYRAFKLVAAVMSDRMAAEQRRHPRAVGLEPRFAELLPEVLISIGPDDLAQLASAAFAPKVEPIL